MRYLRLPLLLLSLAAPTAHAAISGSVFSADGVAVAGARVTAFRPMPLIEQRTRAMRGEAPPPLASATTDSEGAFTLDVKPDGLVQVTIERDGFAPAVEYALQGETSLLVTVTPAAKRTGRITANGKNVAGAAVIATNGQSVIWSTRSAEDGTFAIADPASWAEEIVVVHSDHAPANIAAKAATMDVALVAGSSVSGTVTQRGKPAANARVTAGPWSNVTTGDDGTFVLRHVADDVKHILAFAGDDAGSAARTAAPLAISLEERRVITGTVRNGKQPLAGALVAAYSRRGPSRWSDSHTAITDDKGTFRLSHLDADEYHVTAFGGTQLEFESVSASLRETTLARADLTAKPQEYVTGIVRDEQKRPVAGATVQYSPRELPVVYGYWSQGIYQSRTGADGRFRLPQIPAETPSGTEVRVAAYVRRFAAALSEPLEEGVPVTLTLRAGHELTGIVVDSDGKPVAKAGLVVVQDPVGAVALPIDSAMSSGMMKAWVETDAEGKFSLRVNDTVHDVGVWKEGFAGARVANVRPGGEPVKIVLGPSVEIRGRVTRTNGSAVVQGQIAARSDDGSFGMAELSPDGTFVMRDIRPGRYTVEFSGESAPSVEKEVTAPASNVVLELPATGTVRGRVVDAVTRKPLTTFTVVGRTAGAMEMDSVEDEETFTLELPQGEAELTANADGYMRAEQTTSVEVDKTIEVTLALTRGRTATGFVTDEAGEPIAGATVNVEDGEGITRTNPDGRFVLDSLTRDAVTLTVSANGLVEKKVEVPAGETDPRLDVVLSRGRKASGRVVASDGTPVSGATVAAFGGTNQQTITGADGRFTVAGLGGTRYVLQAKRDELESDLVPLGEGEVLLTMKPSLGAGSIRGTVKGFTDGGWMFGMVTAGDGEPATIGRDGKFSIERIAAGEVELRAWASSARGEASTAPVRVTVVPNGTAEVELAFSRDVTVRGTVTEKGVPVVGRKVRFEGGSGQWSNATGEGGVYTITGLQPGILYEVTVESSSRRYTTRHHVKGSTTFDIAIEWLQIEGRVADESGAPIAAAAVELVTDARDDAGSYKTDANGAFWATVGRGAHIVTVAKPGFATFTQRVDAGSPPLTIRLRRSDGLRVRITDARTGATLDGYAAAIDASGLQIAKSSEAQKDGTMLLPLAPGPYRVAVSAGGYASHSVRTSVPHEGELRFALTPGGTLIVRSESATGDLVRLIMPGGEEYVRCQCNGIAEIRLTGTTTTVEHVAPGAYTMQVLDAQGLVKTTYPVTIVEGQAAVAEINVPD